MQDFNYTGFMWSVHRTYITQCSKSEIKCPNAHACCGFWGMLGLGRLSRRKRSIPLLNTMFTEARDPSVFLHTVGYIPLASSTMTSRQSHSATCPLLLHKSRLSFLSGPGPLSGMILNVVPSLVLWSPNATHSSFTTHLIPFSLIATSLEDLISSYF